MTKSTDVPLPFDAVAFAGALIGGPVLVTVVLCWMFIPIFALIFGGPVYLVIGTPVMLWMVRRFPPTARYFAVAALIANIALCTLILAADRWLPSFQAAGYGETFAFAAWGVIFGPLWAGTFAPLYRRFNRMTRLVSQS